MERCFSFVCSFQALECWYCEWQHACIELLWTSNVESLSWRQAIPNHVVTASPWLPLNRCRPPMYSERLVHTNLSERFAWGSRNITHITTRSCLHRFKKLHTQKDFWGISNNKVLDCSLAVKSYRVSYLCNKLPAWSKQEETVENGADQTYLWLIKRNSWSKPFNDMRCESDDRILGLRTSRHIA